MSELAHLRHSYEAIEAPGDITVATARAHLGRAISGGQTAREKAPRLRQIERRRRIAVAFAAAVVVIVGATSAFATVDKLFLEPARVTRTVDGVRFSFRPPRSWAHGPIERTGDAADTWVSRDFLITRGTVGGQAAEAVIFWTVFPDGEEVAPCTRLLGPVGPSTVDLAAAIAHAPGTKVVNGPERVNLGGRPAYHVDVRVSRRGYCPGYFFTWRNQHWGAFWPGTYAGDAISVWIVEVGGKRFVIEAETKQPESRRPPAGLNTRPTSADVFKVEAEIEKIVGSIRFS